MSAARPAVLLDLDGTLVDPAGSITGGIAATLRDHGLPVPPPEVLDRLVGPPLREGLRSLEGVTEQLLPALVRDYRARYREHGMAASVVYPGVREALEDLGRDHDLVVATSKPTATARRLLEVQGLAGHFVAVCGSSDDETLPVPPGGTKVHAMAEALAAVGMAGDRPRRAVMVGDRHFDLDGAAHHGLPGIGVLWGFGDRAELTAAGADALCADAAALPALCRRLMPAPGPSAGPRRPDGADGALAGARRAL
ncbi:HAD family hydrolase [Citricoccus sp. SGAir0253]|uniref:HAD hydrolase-like protein n=1 Tax=Citricoccus sp. SGAir0253 TaxID=2567881 RepID=UPI0010CD2D67|nr:HAD hydrolase-like protein [Citricoccus sp. SGAir0253]QCU78128.1 HAD family hydrolase [Citricoccus sp. SGAir0253]